MNENIKQEAKTLEEAARPLVEYLSLIHIFSSDIVTKVNGYLNNPMAGFIAKAAGVDLNLSLIHI